MDNYDAFKLRARYANNDRQHDRMVLDKKRSFHRALLYSYQTGWIKKDDSEDDWCRALINPDKVKFDYDEKTLSVDWEYGFQPGDSFEWPKDSGTHWLILKQEMTELAYFRANIRRATYLQTIDPETHQFIKFWAAVRGPVETKINTIQKAGLVADVPNLTLNVYVKKTPEAERALQRYAKFYFAGKMWEVTAPDWISTPNIIEFSAIESFDCDMDLQLLEEHIEPEPESVSRITGEAFIKPLDTVVYRLDPPVPDAEYTWSITLPTEDKKKRLSSVLHYSVQEDNSIEVTWTAMTSGSFVLTYGPYEKTIAVESLF